MFASVWIAVDTVKQQTHRGVCGCHQHEQNQSHSPQAPRDDQFLSRPTASWLSPIQINTASKLIFPYLYASLYDGASVTWCIFVRLLCFGVRRGVFDSLFKADSFPDATKH